jgi:hypothetical protein
MNVLDTDVISAPFRRLPEASVIERIEALPLWKLFPLSND